MTAATRNDLERVFRAEYPRVVSIALRILGDRHAAEDVAQEVFVGFARSTVAGSAARGWLSAAAAHTALNEIRTRRRREDREHRAGTEAGLAGAHLSGDPADDAVRNDERDRVRAGLAALPRTQAVALLMRHSGLAYNEIADALAIAPSGVGTTLRRAEAALRKELTVDGAHH